MSVRPRERLHDRHRVDKGGKGLSALLGIDTLIVGAGVIGLAVARASALRGEEVIVMEAASAVGTGTSSRNSEVIHAGIYYPAGSLKARACRHGRDMLYAYCAERGIAHRRLGKLIVATDAAQIPALEGLHARAQANGVDDLRWLEGREARAMEPALQVEAALHSPSSGIVDSHGLMLALQGEAEDHGAVIAFNTPFQRAEPAGRGGFRVDAGGAEPVRLVCRNLINAAGLHAWDVARRIEGPQPGHIPPRHLAKGNYFALSGARAPFGRLIYPVPEDGGLGIHLTLDLAGQARFGPDVTWLEPDGAPDYAVEPGRAAVFAESIRCYWPGLPEDALVPAYSGIRPKLSGPGEAPADFLVQGPAEHGVPGLVNLFGLESPALTACLFLAEEVRISLDQGPMAHAALHRPDPAFGPAPTFLTDGEP